MNSMLRAALGALVRLLAPGAEASGGPTTGSAGPAADPAPTTDRTFVEQQYVAPMWEHGHVPMSLDLFGGFGRVLDAREEAPGAEQPS